jgi:hypothetical protein
VLGVPRGIGTLIPRLTSRPMGSTPTRILLINSSARKKISPTPPRGWTPPSTFQMPRMEKRKKKTSWLLAVSHHAPIAPSKAPPFAGEEDMEFRCPLAAAVVALATASLQHSSAAPPPPLLCEPKAAMEVAGRSIAHRRRSITAVSLQQHHSPSVASSAALGCSSGRRREQTWSTCVADHAAVGSSPGRRW